MAHVENGRVEGNDARQPPDDRPLSRLRTWSASTWDWLTSGVWSALAWLGLALASWVAKGQVSSIVQAVTPTGQYSVSTLLGPGQLGSLTTPPYPTFSAWAQASMQFRTLGTWLWWYLGMDLLFIIGLGMLGVAILKRRGNAVVARWLLGFLIGASALEAIVGSITLGWALSHHASTGAPHALAWTLHVATELKWVAAIVVLTWSAYRVHASYRAYRASTADRDQRSGVYADIRRLAHALEVQRFSLVVVLLLGLIAIGPPVSGVLEQMPDVQRAWLNSGSSTGRWQMLIAGLTQLLLALMLFLLGRMRTRRADAKFDGRGDDGRPRSSRHRTWLVLPLVVLGLAGLLAATGTASVSWRRVIVFSGILLVIAAASKMVEHWVPPGQRGRGLPTEKEHKVVTTVRLTGDALAVAVIGVTPIGVVRSFTVPALVIGDAWPGRALLIGLIGAAALPWCWKLLCRLGDEGRAPGGASARRQEPASQPHRRGERQALAGRTLGLWVVAALFIVADVWLILVPFAATRVLGALGTAVIAIGSLASLLSALAYLAQTRLPLPIFGALRMNVTPVLTIVLVIAIVGGIADKNSALHQVRPPVATGGTARPTLSQQLSRWFQDAPTGSCAIQAPGAALVGGHQIRIVPLIQVAASGGGIRAAWWAVKVLGTVASSPCGARDVFAVSSISGGSVGVAVLASATSGAGAANASITTMAGPDALAAAIDGLMLRDAIAGYTGIDLTAAQAPGNDRSPDRAALMETVWQNEDGSLRQPFPLRHSWLNWALLFNSTSVSTGCRAIISSVRLPRMAPTVPSGQACGLGTAGLAGSYDFFDRLRCMRNIATSTAAMLSARYAYITPSGTVTGCGKARKLADQLVDGGYGEGSGLSTLIDLAPTVMSRVRQYNDQAITSARPGQPITLVVPVTVYLGNSIQPALSAVQASRTPELQAVSTALSIGPLTELTSADALLQNMLAVTGPSQWVTCGSADALCLGAVTAAQRAVPNQLIMVAPREFPGVAAPLGWLLSQASQRALDQALRRDIHSRRCGQYAKWYAEQRPYCLPGVGGMADLLALTSSGG